MAAVRHTDEQERFKLAVWSKGRAIPNYDSDVWRHDDFGKVMRHLDYGNRDSEFGWEFDHITPRSEGGVDNLSNLRPLNWNANVRR